VQSLPEVHRLWVAVLCSGASTVTWPGRVRRVSGRRPCSRSAERSRSVHDTSRKTRAPLRQQGCPPLESHRGLKHEGIL
jgi:hypothetical protein